jgi:branched-chain amino acid transport system substrate-binding protein
VSPFRRLPAWLLAALLLTGCSQSPSTEPIVVGHLAPFSGADKAVGELERQGIILAVEEVNNSDEKINGRRVEVHHADDRGPTGAADEAVRLLAVTRAVALLGGATSDRAEQIGRAAQPYGAPLVTPSPLPAPLAAETAFSTCVPPAHQGQALARFAAQELKAKRVAVLVDARSAVGTGVAAGFAKEFAAAGERQADQYRYDSDAGLADLPERVGKAKPDAALLAVAAADFARLRDKLTWADVKGPVLFGGEESAWPAVVADPDASRGVYALTTFAAEGLTPRGEEFAKKYQERFQEAPDLRAASAYDGARLLFEALRRAGSSKPEAVVKALGGPDSFESVTGPLTIDKDDHGARRPVFVVQRQEGQTKVVKRYDANLR